jgi:predicted dehydrogenase
MNRRDLVKGLATLPILGSYILAVSLKQKNENEKVVFNFLKEFEKEHPIINIKSTPAPVAKAGNNKTLRLGFIGYGGRGADLGRAAGFAHPDMISELKAAAEKDSTDKRYETFIGQEDLNIVFTGICDLYTPRAEKGMVALANREKKGKDEFKGQPIKRFNNFRELIHSPEVDAVIIATPDFWHAEMIIEAANAGKHVYCEKCMTNELDEAYLVRDAVKKNGVVFQLGHQNRQSASYIKAAELLEKDKNLLGKISLVETSTNRSSPGGAWEYDIPEEANESNVDWKQFIKPGMKNPFNKAHFFRWRCWWDYGSGLTGDLLSHEYDCINQVLKLGIPERVSSSGGIYYWKDGRTVPDIFNSVMEYPDRDLSLIYSATLGNSRERKRMIMGGDATMELGGNIQLYVDGSSKKYEKYLKSGQMNSEVPFLDWQPAGTTIDAMTSATHRYFASRGLMYTMLNGKLTDATFLHIKEWTECIRTNQMPSCNIDQGFQEAITCHMGTKAFKEKRMVIWDKEKEKVI